MMGMCGALRCVARVSRDHRVASFHCSVAMHQHFKESLVQNRNSDVSEPNKPRASPAARAGLTVKRSSNKRLLCVFHTAEKSFTSHRLYVTRVCVCVCVSAFTCADLTKPAYIIHTHTSQHLHTHLTTLTHT